MYSSTRLYTCTCAIGVEKKAPKIVPETLPMLSPVLVLSQQIQLLYKIGSGEQNIGMSECVVMFTCKGEFGVVYKALFTASRADDCEEVTVAVKTLNGINN